MVGIDIYLVDTMYTTGLVVAQVREDFAAIDADQNVKISLSEFREYVEKMRLATTQRKLLDHVAEFNAAYGGERSASSGAVGGSFALRLFVRSFVESVRVCACVRACARARARVCVCVCAATKPLPLESSLDATTAP